MLQPNLRVIEPETETNEKKYLNKVIEKKYISQSQLNLFTICAEAYRRRYIEKEIIPPGFTLITGSSIHKSIEENFKQKIKTKEDLKENDVIDIALTEFEEKINDEGILLTQEEQSIGYDKIKGYVKDRTVRISKLFINEVAQDYQPQFVEEKYRIEIPTSDYDLMAVLDLADENGVVTDFKTSGRKKNQIEIDTSDQLSFYSLVYKAKTGKLPKCVRLDNLIDRQLKSGPITEFQRLESKRKMSDLEVLVNRLNTMINGIEKGVFMPCDRNHWKCSENYCGYYNTCKYVSKGGK